MLNLNAIMIGTKQTQAMTAFYEKVFGRPADMADTENGFYGWKVGSKAKDPGRVLLNFETPQVRQEFERIKTQGAVVVRAPYEMGGGWIATLADPDGNYFQLVTPMPM